MDAYFWIILAFSMAAATAVQVMVAEFSGQKPIHVLFWVRLFSVIGISPFVLYFGLPSDPWFYAAVAVNIAIFAYADIVWFGTAASYGAGIVTRVKPLAVWGTFVIWTMANPALLMAYIDAPLRSLIIIGALMICVYFALRLKQCPLSWDVIRKVFHLIVLSAIGMCFNKFAMDHSPAHSGVYAYIWLQGLGIIILYGLFSILKIGKTPPLIATRPVMLAGLAAALASTTHLACKNYAFKMVENPAYVTAIGLTAPLWVLLVYKLIGRKEKADIIAGLGIVVSAAILTLAVVRV